MKKYSFTIQGSSYEVEILNLENRTAKIEVNGTLYDVEIAKEVMTSKTPKLVRSIVKPPKETEDKGSAGVTKVNAYLDLNQIVL